ncbi:hypothetical protein DSI38_10540 [Mycobacterium tuberculosis]|nr:hypothetical protein DSI38_10540 [Mycobacterium tuberculosis]
MCKAQKDFGIAFLRSFPNRRQERIDGSEQRDLSAFILFCAQNTSRPIQKRPRIFLTMREAIEHPKSADSSADMVWQ